jgi:hypothetical protein
MALKLSELEIFRALEFSRLESIRALKLTGQIGVFYGPKILHIGEFWVLKFPTFSDQPYNIP